MARRVFFSFHYERDAWRAGQVRNSNVIKNNSIETSDFIDSAKWEEIKRGGDDAIKRWIANQLNGTSVTVILIGAKTSERKWIKYEIDESLKKGNGLLGVRIHNIKDQNQQTDTMGTNPFDNLYFDRDGRKVYLSEIYQTYDWVNDNGRDNLGNWIEKSAKDANR
ncbi:MAG: TIR-like domain-containing protein [Candidatus Altiarchaeales archaeon IMC4]|nr:MAG: TIR-like domain-containing protein [Candidatus Altiarchaeales archaeon IMC4]